MPITVRIARTAESASKILTAWMRSVANGGIGRLRPGGPGERPASVMEGRREEQQIPAIKAPLQRR
jgi:hypothetical protein